MSLPKPAGAFFSRKGWLQRPRCLPCHPPVNEHGVSVAYADLTLRDIEADKEAPIGGHFDLAVQLIHATAPDRGGS
jgi:hypothetical protein